MDKRKVFSPVSDADVTRAIMLGFSKMLESHISSDVIVVGAGPSGLVCARELAKKGGKVLLVERNNYLGGGFWIGGFLMNTLTVRSPAHEELGLLGVRLTETSPGLYAAHAPEACSKLIASACDAGVTMLNMVSVEDVVLRNGRVKGVVVNWTPVRSLPREITCVDPVSFEARLVVDATGHDAAVCRCLAERNIMDIPGMAPMDAENSEDAIVAGTGEVFPGLIACGMSVSTVKGLPRMGPTFGAMLLSGRKAAEKAMELLNSSMRTMEPAVKG